MEAQSQLPTLFLRHKLPYLCVTNYHIFASISIGFFSATNYHIIGSNSLPSPRWFLPGVWHQWSKRLTLIFTSTCQHLTLSFINLSRNCFVIHFFIAPSALSSYFLILFTKACHLIKKKIEKALQRGKWSEGKGSEGKCLQHWKFGNIIDFLSQNV